MFMEITGPGSDTGPSDRELLWLGLFIPVLMGGIFVGIGIENENPASIAIGVVGGVGGSLGWLGLLAALKRRGRRRAADRAEENQRRIAEAKEIAKRKGIEVTYWNQRVADRILKRARHPQGGR